MCLGRTISPGIRDDEWTFVGTCAIDFVLNMRRGRFWLILSASFSSFEGKA